MSRTHAHAPLFVKAARRREESHNHARFNDVTEYGRRYPDACTINEHTRMYSMVLTERPDTLATCYYHLPWRLTGYLHDAPRGLQKRQAAAKFRRHEKLLLRAAEKHHYHRDQGDGHYDDEFPTRNRHGLWGDLK